MGRFCQSCTQCRTVCLRVEKIAKKCLSSLRGLLIITSARMRLPYGRCFKISLGAHFGGIFLSDVSVLFCWHIYQENASYMCDINRISHRHNTRQSDSAYVVPRVKGQGSKSFKFNGSKLCNELPTNVKHAQQKNRFKK